MFEYYIYAYNLHIQEDNEFTGVVSYTAGSPELIPVQPRNVRTHVN